MKIVFIGGEKVSHIQSSLDKRFKSTTVDIDYIQYLDELNEFVKNGEVVDRVVIMENAYMSTTQEPDNAQIASATMDLADTIQLLSESRKVEVVFLLEDLRYAKPIQQEMFALMDSLRLIERKDRKVKTFEDVIIQDLKNMTNVIDPYVIDNMPNFDSDDLMGEEESQFESLEFTGDDFSSSGENESDFDFSFDTLNTEDEDSSFEAMGEFESLGDFGEPMDFDFEEANLEDTETDIEDAEENPLGDFTAFSDGDGLGGDFLTPLTLEHETQDDEPYIPNTEQPTEVNKPLEIDETPFTEIESFEDLNEEQEDFNFDFGQADFDFEPAKEVQSTPEEKIDNTPFAEIEGFGDLEDEENNFEDFGTADFDTSEFSGSTDLNNEEFSVNEEFNASDFGSVDFDTTEFNTDSDFSISDTPMSSENKVSNTRAERPKDTPTKPVNSNRNTVNKDESTTKNETANAKNKKFSLGGLFSKNKSDNAPQAKERKQARVEDKAEEFKLDNNVTEDEYQFIRTQLNKMSIKKASYVFAGTQCSGTSTMAYNIGKLISKMGFTVLLVGMDNKNRPYSYMTYDLYDIVHSSENNALSLPFALNNGTDIPNYTNIEAEGFHVLSVGLNQNYRPIDKIVTKDNLNRFNGFARQMYNFVIYDMSVETMESIGIDIAFNCDSIIYTVESSTDGLIRAMNEFGNINDEHLRALMFSKSRVVLTKYLQETTYFGKRIRKERELLKYLDDMVDELTGEISDYRMSELRIAGIVPFKVEFLNDTMTNNNNMINNIENQKMLMRIIHSMLEY